MNIKWDKRFIELARLVADWSKDPSTQCGAVITREKRVVSVGFNGFAQGTDDVVSLYEDRPEKYRRILHAEQNAMLFSKESLDGCTCYVWPMPPCSTCTAMLIQSGIKRIVSVAPAAARAERWGNSLRSAMSMMRDAGVTIELLEVGDGDNNVSAL